VPFRQIAARQESSHKKSPVTEQANCLTLAPETATLFLFRGMAVSRFSVLES
jgi:hypothetical protein